MKKLFKRILSFLLFSFIMFSCLITPTLASPLSPGVSYSAHVQNIGWQTPVTTGTSGTVGQSLRVEAFKINLTDAPEGASISYQVHVQSIGWMASVADGALAGTTGQSLRTEAIKITMTGVPNYSVEYRVHVQTIGWMDWVRDGSLAGTTGRSLRMEAIQIRIVKSIPVISVAVSGDAVYGETLTATIAPSPATVTYAWQVSDTVDGTYTPITGASASTYTIGKGLVGKYIRVLAKGYDDYSGTVTSASSMIEAAPLTVTGAIAADKVYDGNSTATISGASLSGVIGSDTVTLGNKTSGSFANKNAGTEKTVTTVMTISGTDVGNYALTQPTLSADITKAPLTLTGAIAANKAYDGNTAATISEATLSGVIGSDTVTLGNTTSGSFDDKNAGTGKTVTTEMTLSGTDAGNYALTQSILSADITKVKPTNITWPTLTSITYGEKLSASNLSWNGGNPSTPGEVFFVNPDTIPDAGNYSSYLVFTPTDSTNYESVNQYVNITVHKALLTVTADDKEKTYGETDPTFTVSFTSLVNDDTASSLGGTLAFDRVTGENVGTYTITPKGYTSDNYTISYDTGTLTINKALLTVTPDDKSKTYGEDDPTLTVCYTTLVNGDTASSLGGTLSLQRDEGEDADTYDITASGYTSSNYTISYETGTFTIDTKDLTITATDTSKTYGETITFAGTEFTTSGMVGEEDIASVSLSSSGAAATADASAYDYDISISSAVASSGTKLTNYSITYVDGDLTVNKRPITVTAESKNKVYDGGTSSSGTPTITSGTLANSQTASWSQSFGSKGVGTSKTLTATGSVSDGNSGDNYTVTFVSASGNITVKTLTLSSFTASDKTYDGSTSVSDTGFSDDRVTGDDLSFSYSASFASANVANGITVNYTSISVSGTDASNYSLASTTGSTTADITKKDLSITADDKEKTYDGSVYSSASFTVSYSGFVSEESSANLTGSISYSGTAITAINAGTYTITPSGQSSSNYNITYYSGDLDIDKATPTVSTWPTAKQPITTQQAVSAAGLQGGSASGVVEGESLAGSFGFKNPDYVPGTLGSHTIDVVFTPTDTTNYNTVSGTVTVEVEPLIFESISLFLEDEDSTNDSWIQLNFNMQVARNAYLTSANDFMVIIERADGSIDEVRVDTVVQPSLTGTKNSFIIKLVPTAKPTANDVVHVYINNSGALKLEDVSGGLLDTTVLTRKCPEAD